MNKSLAEMQPHIAGNHVAGGKLHHVAGDELLEGNFPWLPVAQNRGGDLDHRLEFGRRVAGVGFLHETQRHAERHHHQHHDAAIKLRHVTVFRLFVVITDERKDGQDRQQNDQRIADGDPEPVQPFMPPFLRDLVGAVLLQPRLRLRFHQAVRRRTERLQDLRAFPGCGFTHKIGCTLIVGIVRTGHKSAPSRATRTGTPPSCGVSVRIK